MSPRCSPSDPNCRLDFGERLGIFITILASSLSAIAGIGLLSYAVVRAIRRWPSSRRAATYSSGSSDASASILFLSLVVADLIQAIGGMPNWKWMLDATLTEDPLCTFQGLFLNLGNVAIALSDLSIAFHTFVVLILRWRVTRTALRIVVAAIWCLSGLIVGASNRGQEKYYGPTGYWCWITDEYPTERVVAEYLWLWIGFFTMIVLYGYMFLSMRNIIKSNRNLRGSPRTATDIMEEQESERIAYLMLFYPAIYIFCIAPVSISRWLGWSRPDYNESAAAIFFSNVVFSLSGFLNLILFYITRPSLVTGSTDSLSDAEMQVPDQAISRDGQKIAMNDMQPAGHGHSIKSERTRTGKVLDTGASVMTEPLSGGNSQQQQQQQSPIFASTTHHVHVKPSTGRQDHGRLPD